MNAPEVARMALEISPEHEDIDCDLESWGRWSRDRTKRVRCGSGERDWRSPQPWDAPPLTAVLPANGRLLAIDRAILGIPEKHREAIKMHYWRQLPDWLIARRLAIPFADLSKWLHDARCMVANRMRMG